MNIGDKAPEILGKDENGQRQQGFSSLTPEVQGEA